LSKKIFAHGFFTLQGKKISKTSGNIIYVSVLVEKYGADAVRYSLLREIPFGQDGDISEEKIANRYNNDLANDLGNLVLRTITLVKKAKLKGEILKVEVSSLKIDNLLQNLKFKEVLEKIFQEVKEANFYINKEKPWQFDHSDKKLRQILQILQEKILLISKSLEPFMPETSTKIQSQLQTLKAEPLFPRIK